MTCFFGTHDKNCTWRTKMYSDCPKKIEKSQEGYLAEVGKRYQFDVEICETSARYSIDGSEYASCQFNEGDVPVTGFLGFGVPGMYPRFEDAAKEGGEEDEGEEDENLVLEEQTPSEMAWDENRGYFIENFSVQGKLIKVESPVVDMGDKLIVEGSGFATEEFPTAPEVPEI